MIRKKGLVLMLVIAVSVVIAGVGCSPENKGATSEDSDITKLKIANYYAADHPVNVHLTEVFKKDVEEKTDGTVEIEIYPNNQLGDEQEVIEGVQIGSIEMATSGNLWENTVPEFRIMQMPYMFMNYDHADEVLNGPVGESIYEYLEPLNVKVLASFPNGFRVVSNNVRPIETIEDTKGINLRVFEGDTIIKLMQSLGFDTTIMSMSELFTALQQGVVDGQDNPLATSYYAGFYEIQDYVALTNHMYSPGYIVINNNVWNQLTSEEQKIIEGAAQKTVAKIKESTEDLQDEIIETIEAAGVEVTFPELQPFREKAAPIIDEYIEECPHTKDIIKQIRELGEKYE